MDILRGKTPALVRKEVWAHILMYNVVRTILAQAARVAKVRPEDLSFAGALQTLNAFLPQLRLAETEEGFARQWAAMVLAISQHRVGDRPDRVEPRAVKRRPKNYPRLREPR